VNIIGGAHCYFANTNFNCDFGEGTTSTGISITRAEQQQRTYSLLDLWLDYTLRGNCEAYANFVNALDDTPATLATETTCQLNQVPTINVNGSVLTSSITGDTYQWYLNGNEILSANGQNYSVTSVGDYTVEVIFTDGCSEISSPVTINELGISADVLIDFVLSPNPTNGLLSITNNSGELIEVEVFDQKGLLLLSQLIDQKIDISNLCEGIYFVNVGGLIHRVIKY
jgi:hypothetical protein